MPRKVIGHGRRLTQNFVGMWIEHAIGEAMQTRSCGRGGGGILPNKDLCMAWQQGTKREYEKAQMSHAREEQIGLKMTDEPNDLAPGAADTLPLKAVYCDAGRQTWGSGMIVGNGREMDVKATRIEVDGELRHDLFGSAPSKVRNN